MPHFSKPIKLSISILQEKETAYSGRYATRMFAVQAFQWNQQAMKMEWKTSCLLLCIDLIWPHWDWVHVVSTVLSWPSESLISRNKSHVETYRSYIFLIIDIRDVYTYDMLVSRNNILRWRSYLCTEGRSGRQRARGQGSYLGISHEIATTVMPYKLSCSKLRPPCLMEQKST